MSEYTTIARPYAKAAFEHALSHKAMETWGNALQALMLSCSDERALAFFDNPNVDNGQKTALLEAVLERVAMGDEAQNITNFVQLLADNNRLVVVPEIYGAFEVFRSAYENTLEVTVRTFSALNDTQKEALMASLEKRLHRKIIIKEVLDESLLGGAIVQAGDMVIDGSVRGKLAKLATDLAA